MSLNIKKLLSLVGICTKGLAYIYLVYTPHVQAQVLDVLELENFDFTTNLMGDAGGFANEGSGCSSTDMFDITDNDATSASLETEIGFETGSFFCGADIDGIAGLSTPTYLEVFNYTANHNDDISFVGNFAVATGCGASGYSGAEVIDVYYSTDGGATWSATPSLTLTGTDGGAGTGNDYFVCSDGSAEVQNNFLEKSFSIGSGHIGQTIKVKVEFTGFTSGGEAFFFDEFKLVRTRTQLVCENFDNTTGLTSSSGVVFQTPNEDASNCDGNALYDVTANMATPSSASNCVSGETGSFFVLTERQAIPGVADGEELEVLSYTAVSNNHISFKGDFASFALGQNFDNLATISYSTDNGVTYIDALTFTGVSGTIHSVSDGSADINHKFVTKRFPIGSGLSGQTIKVKVTFTEYTNSNDGIALDEFCLEGSVDPIVLPVELSNFEASSLKSAIELTWSTSSEINFSHFEVQKSNDGLPWQNIGEVSASGNSSEKLLYNFIDYQPFQNKNFYRLKQVDFDNSFAYSKVEIEQFNVSQVYAYPSIVLPGGNFNIKGISNTAIIQLYSMKGQLIKTVELSSENSQIIADFAKGIYILNIQNDGFITNKKLIVK